MNEDLELSLSKAKIGIMTKHKSVFISTVLFSLTTVWDETLDTAATDGSHIFINPYFWLKLTPAEQIGLLAHEAWHVAFNHMSRGKGLDQRKYNLAADHVINLMLLDTKYELPTNGYADTQYTGMSTEEVYALLPDPPEQYVMDIIEASADVGISIAQTVMKAAMAAQASGEKAGDLPGEIGITIDKFLNPVLPWNNILINYMNGYAKDDYSFRRPNKRFAPEYYLPSLYSESLTEIAVAIDSSGSVTDEEFVIFMSEINSIRSTLNPTKTTILNFDTKVQNIVTLDQGASTEGITFTGRGGTNLTPMMEHFNKYPPTVLIVFSDLDCASYTVPPKYDVIWICINNPKAKVQFGKLIHMET